MYIFLFYRYFKQGEKDVHNDKARKKRQRRRMGHGHQDREGEAEGRRGFARIPLQEHRMQ